MNLACTKCRREGKKLFVKGDKCLSPKCAFTRRSYGPGSHGQTTSARLSEYGTQLREKRSAQEIYGVNEAQFRNYFIKASKSKGNTDEKLLEFLETRLDNILFRAGLFMSRSQARQAIIHSHVLLNNRVVNKPAINLSNQDKITLKPKFIKSKLIQERKKILKKAKVPSWIKTNSADLSVEIIRMPGRDDYATQPFDPSLIVEFYSR